MNIFKKTIKPETNCEISVTVACDPAPGPPKEIKTEAKIHKVEVEDCEVTFQFSSPNGSVKKKFDGYAYWSHSFYSGPGYLDYGNGDSAFRMFLENWKTKIWEQFETRLVGFHQLKGAKIKRTKRIIEVTEPAHSLSPKHDL